MTAAKFSGDKGEVSETVRQFLRPELLLRSRAPKWILSAVKLAVKSRHIPAASYPPRSAMDALQYVLACLGQSWADHVGLLEWDGRELLVAEPYADRIDLEMLQELQRFTETLGCAFMFSANSWHFPGRTVRIIIAESTGVLSSYKNSQCVTATEFGSRPELPIP